MGAKYEFEPEHAVQSFVVGSLVGGGLVAFPFLASGGGVLLFLFVFVVAFIVFTVGLTIVGAPLWALFHYFGWRNPFAAMLLGFCAAFATFALLTRGAWLGATLIAIVGAFVGLTIWRVAYRRTADRQQAPFFE